MWLVRLTAKSNSGIVSQHLVRIAGDRADDLLFNGEFKWKHMDAMLKRGTLLKIEIDFKSQNGWG